MAERKAKAALDGRHYGLLFGAVAALALSIGAFFYAQDTSNANGSPAAALIADTLEVAKLAAEPAHGKVPDFKKLAGAVKTLDDNVQHLNDAALSDAWKPLRASLDTLVSGEAAYTHAASDAATIAGAIPGISSNYEQIVDRLGTHSASTGQILLVASQLVHLQRLQNLATQVIGDGHDAQTTISTLNREAQQFARDNRQITEPGQGNDFMPVKDNTVDSQVKQVGNDFAAALNAAGSLQANVAAISKIQDASAASQAQIEALVAAARHSSANAGFTTVRQLGYIAILISAVLIVGFIFYSSSTLTQHERVNEEHENRQQQAILSLLDEITNLANGDLTVDVTVTEDFTGAIADSINYTVQTLRSLVGTINSSSAEVVAAAANTQNIARQVNAASERQAREISAVTNIVTATSESLQNVSGRAESLAAQAQQSVQTAHDGAGTVGRTIQNMAALREQIQDTAKRIKRLGESSQEIGNITELINDIAEQTNTLALNASIQAAMAGDAGRGFAVVADEVQRLAERAASATRQIENLVKTIQADTNEAIISMERSTANVVSGAKSAEEAGQALTEIEATSQELADLIQEIAHAASSQSNEATRIAGTMQSIREIAVQTSGTADQAAQSVGELNTLSDKLRESVAGFKLPADMEL